LQLIAALPECAAGAVPALSASGLPDCRPPQDQVDLMKPFVSAALAQAAAAVPDQVDLLDPFQKAGVLTFDQYGLPMGPRELLQFGRQLVVFSPLLCLAILGLIALLAVRSWTGLLRWWGVPILIAGAAAAVMAVVAWVGMNALLSIGRESLPAMVSLSVFDSLSGVMVYVANRVLLAFAVEGVAVGALGCLLVALSYVIVFRRRRAAAARSGPAADSRRASGLFG
jgi:hypothetical protein